MASSHPLARGAQQRQRIDAVVVEEAMVLISAEQREVALIDLISARGQAPFAVRRLEGAQHGMIGAEDNGRCRARPAEIGREKCVGGKHCHGESACRGNARNQEAAPHGRASTVTVPIAVRARIFGRYMSSAVAAGST